MKQAHRVIAAGAAVTDLAARAEVLKALHVHGLVRLQEPAAMMPAARFILAASLERTESRLSHVREDYRERDDTSWLCWVDIEARKARRISAGRPFRCHTAT